MCEFVLQSPGAFQSPDIFANALSGISAVSLRLMRYLLLLLLVPAVAGSELGRRQRGHDVGVLLDVATQLGYSVASIAEQTFSKVSAIVHLLNKMTK